MSPKQSPLVGSLLVKFGGSVASGAGGDPVLADLVRLAGNGIAITLVHGGGPAVDAELRAREITTRRIGGLRVSDAVTLAIVEEVLGRQVNASIVSALTGMGGCAQRVAGDEGVFVARKLELPVGDLGFVGEIESVETRAVRGVLERRFIPVVSPIGADRAGQRYNINADTAAGALAAALGVDAYVVITDVSRVRLDRFDPQSGIARMTLDEARMYRAQGIFVDGMLPKIDAAIDAVRAGVQRAVICGTGEQAISAALAGSGTEIVR